MMAIDLDGTSYVRPCCKLRAVGQRDTNPIRSPAAGSLAAELQGFTVTPL